MKCLDWKSPVGCTLHRDDFALIGPALFRRAPAPPIAGPYARRRAANSVTQVSIKPKTSTGIAPARFKTPPNRTAPCAAPTQRSQGQRPCPGPSPLLLIHCAHQKRSPCGWVFGNRAVGDGPNRWAIVGQPLGTVPTVGRPQPLGTVPNGRVAFVTTVRAWPSSRPCLWNWRRWCR